MSGRRRPSPSEHQRATVNFESNPASVHFMPAVTETHEFAMEPPSLATKLDEPARSGTEYSLFEAGSTIAPQHQATPKQILDKTVSAYYRPGQVPMPSYNLANMTTIAVAVVAALAMVLTFSFYRLSGSPDTIPTAADSSTGYDSATVESDLEQGAVPMWSKGNVGMFDEGDGGQGQSATSNNGSGASPSPAPSNNDTPEPLPPTTLPTTGEVDLEATDTSAGSNSNLGNLVSTVPTKVYANCTEAINAGVAPLVVGTPGYRSALDADDDGIACETGSETRTTVNATRSTSTPTVAPTSESTRRTTSTLRTTTSSSTVRRTTVTSPSIATLPRPKTVSTTTRSLTSTTISTTPTSATVQVPTTPETTPSSITTTTDSPTTTESSTSTEPVTSLTSGSETTEEPPTTPTSVSSTESSVEITEVSAPPSSSTSEESTSTTDDEPDESVTVPQSNGNANRNSNANGNGNGNFVQ